VLEAVPVVRALAAAGETELLVRMAEAIRETSSDLSANAFTAVLAAEGLLSLLQGRAEEAVEQLEAAIERERELGRTYDAACLELDLARALEAMGQKAAAQKAQARAAAVLEPLGCVNPF
jgi:tetratricopeptide (TPR) repeat protein